MQKITFYIPSRIYGGAERQMALLACLASDNGFDVTVIDSKIGIVANILKNRKEISIVTESIEKKIHVKDSILITQASYAFCINSMINITNCDVRFWFMHSLNLPDMYIEDKLPIVLKKIYSLIFKRLYKKRLKKYSSSLFFMGEDIKETIEKNYNIELNSNCTGMLSEKKSYQQNFSESKDNATKNSICWLGRLDKNSKLIIIKKLLYDFSFSEKYKKGFYFKIIGDGDAKKELISYAKSLNIKESVIFHGHIDFEDLPNILSDSMIMFAHGTSVYEGINNNIPVCLIDFYTSNEHIQKMRYEFYADHDSNGFGTLITSIDDPLISKGKKFDKLLNEADTNKEKILEKQNSKLSNFLKFGEEKCQILFEKPRYGKEYPNSIFIDILFFKLRKLSLKIQNSQ
tara:strand:- start:123 stop:1328 length:1206 start_codon:yes stop_codon:yes gene_type:complete